LEWAVIVCLPAAVGLYLHTRQVAIDEAVALAAAMAKAARQDERTRIAREMHDVLAHKISLIALHAGALELTAEGTQTSQTAAIVGQTARQALEELRSVIGVLRTEQGDQRTPQPSITDLDRVIDEWREAGTHVTLQDMTPAGYLDTVPTQVGRAAYRIVQESLTNASKHAPGSTIEIVMQALDGSLDLAVHNRAAARVSSRATTGSGTGLIGLRERVDLLGGCFEAGPDERGGYRVHARLPLNTVEH
ncbi:MAG: sensor histidine kinase, partial [Acidimicrobiaceae bacterium]|nr:sensor histidine kinase [Acidimicrobiaceae bacterium]